ncbi:MAG: DUF2336 domain-containing protein [Methyloligellaceae bacterium]
MSDAVKELEALIDLAKEPSSEKRRSLLRGITDSFVQNGNELSVEQSHSYAEIMKQLSADMESEIRGELALKLAPLGYSPHSIIQALAQDEIQVARPILEQSPVLTEDDLAEICKAHSQEHLRAVTKRPEVSSRLSGIIVSRGDDQTVHSLLENERVELNTETMARIAVRARKAKLLQDPLIERKDISKDVLVGLYSSVAKELKDKILKAYKEFDAENVEPAIDQLTDNLSQAKAYSIEDHIEDLHRAGRLTEAQLLKFVEERKLMEFLAAFAKMMNIDIATAQLVMDDQSGKSLVVVCKSKNISPSVFKSIAMSAFTSITNEPSELLPLVNIYRRFDVENAERVMRFWSTRSAMDTHADLAPQNLKSTDNEPAKEDVAKTEQTVFA